MRNAGLDETQAGIKIAGRNINNLRYADDTTVMAESEEELKRLLMKINEGLVHWDNPEGWYGREEGRGFRMGNTCIPVADSFRYLAKLTQFCKV